MTPSHNARTHEFRCADYNFQFHDFKSSTHSTDIWPENCTPSPLPNYEFINFNFFFCSPIVQSTSWLQSPQNAIRFCNHFLLVVLLRLLLLNLCCWPVCFVIRTEIHRAVIRSYMHAAKLIQINKNFGSEAGDTNETAKKNRTINRFFFSVPSNCNGPAWVCACLFTVYFGTQI